MSHTISTAPGQLRQITAGRGLGRQALIKPASPPAGANFIHVVPGEYWERVLTMSAQLVTGGAGANRTVSIVMQDGDGFTFNLTPINAGQPPGQTVQIYADLQSVTQTQPQGGSANEGSVTNPGALATIVSVPIAGGANLVKWTVQLSGTIAAADANNMQLPAGTNNTLTAMTLGAAGIYPQPDMSIFVQAAGSTLIVRSIGAASGAAAVYSAQVTALPYPGFANQAQIPDMMLKSGWQIGLQIGGIQPADQLSNISLMVERYPSSDVYALEGDILDQLAEAMLLRRG